MTDWATAQYEARVYDEPDVEGYYRVDILVDGRVMKSEFSQDLDAAVQEARDWVTWRRTATDLYTSFRL